MKTIRTCRSMKGEGNSLLCCYSRVVTLTTIFFILIWFNYFVTAMEEHESQLFQVECGEECSQPAGEQRYYVLFKECILINFNMLSTSNILFV